MAGPTIDVRSSSLDQTGRPVVEPGAFLCDGNVSLRVNVWNALTGVTVTIRMRFLGIDGQEVDNSFDVTPATNRTKTSLDFALGVGFPLNIIAFASAGAPTIGQTFVQVQLVRGSGGAALPMATLIQSYCTSVQTLSFPGSPILSSLEGAGAVRVITGTQPGAGVEVTETVPAGARWQVLSFLGRFQTSAAVAARVPGLLIDDGANILFGGGPNSNQPASQTVKHIWAPGNTMVTSIDGSYVLVPMPIGLTLSAGARMRTLTSLIDAADQWSQIVYLVREWLEAAA